MIAMQTLLLMVMGLAGREKAGIVSIYYFIIFLFLFLQFLADT